jgi:hypothetical protein
MWHKEKSMGYQAKMPVFFASDKQDADNIRNSLREDYIFYIRLLRMLTNNNRHWKLINEVNNIIDDLNYKYNNVVMPPSIR